MPAITSLDLSNAKLDVDHIAAIATSTAPTATDRLGHVKKTMQGASDAVSIEIAAIEASRIAGQELMDADVTAVDAYRIASQASMDADTAAVDTRKVQALTVDIPAAVATVAAINNRGAWATGTSYTYKDIVLDGGIWYMCVVPHTSSSSFATDVSSKWRVYQGVTSGDLAAPGGAGIVGYQPAGVGAVGESVESNLRRHPSLVNYGADPTGTVDSGPAFQRCHDVLGPLGVTSVDMPDGIYWVNSPVSLDTFPMKFIGRGTTFGSGAGKGSWLKITNSTITPFTVSAGGRGGGFFNVGISQTHPAPGVGWAPTAYPDVFNLNAVGGEYFLKNIFCSPVYRLCTSLGSGRLNVRGIRGQLFSRGIYVDNALDANRIIDIHQWPYWSTDNNVLAYQQANLDLLVLGRCDTPIIDMIFSFCTRSVLRTVTTGFGNPSQMQIGSIAGDATKYVLWNQSALLTASIAVLNGQGEAVPTGSGVPVVGGAVMQMEGDNARVLIGQMHGERYAKNVVRFTAAAVGSTVFVSNGDFINTNQDNDGSALVADQSGSSVVTFGAAPNINASNGARMGAPSVAPLLQNDVVGSVNEVRAFRAANGAAPSLQPIGADAVIDLVLQPQGATGSLHLNANGKTILRVDDASGSGATNVLVRPSAGGVNFIMEGTVANVDMQITPKGAGKVQLGGTGYTGTADVPITGYITIKDSSGTTRKLAIIT